MVMMLKVEREHIKKNREDLEAYKIMITERAEAAEKVERRVKEHLCNTRLKNIGKSGLSITLLVISPFLIDFCFPQR